MDSLNFRVSATIADSLSDGVDINSLLTEVCEGLQHPQGELILTEVETSLMEQVHCGVVTVVTRK